MTQPKPDPLLVLASSSPRRQQLLRQLGREFAVVRPDIEEKRRPNEDVITYVRRNALEKAERVAPQFPRSIVISADTVVALNDDILEKPADAADAESMLTRLSGTTHQVFTGLCVMRIEPQARILIHAESRIQFRKLSLREIRAYVQTGEPMDKAGAYGAQGDGGKFIKQVQGSLTNVVGLPMNELTEILKKEFELLL